MSFTVKFEGQTPGQGIWVDTVQEAEERVDQLTPDQFPAYIHEFPEGRGVGVGRLVREYNSPPR